MAIVAGSQWEVRKTVCFCFDSIHVFFLRRFKSILFAKSFVFHPLPVENGLIVVIASSSLRPDGFKTLWLWVIEPSNGRVPELGQPFQYPDSRVYANPIGGIYSALLRVRTNKLFG